MPITKMLNYHQKQNFSCYESIEDETSILFLYVDRWLHMNNANHEIEEEGK